MAGRPAAPARPDLRRPAALHRAPARGSSPPAAGGSLQDRVRVLLRAFGPRLRGRRSPTRSCRAQFRLTDWEETLLAVDPGYRGASPASRLDPSSSLDDDRMGLTEYNAETPAGAGYNDALCDAFLDLPVMRAFRPPVRGPAAPCPARRAARAARCLGAVFRRAAPAPGSRSSTGRDVPTRSEFVLFQRLLRVAWGSRASSPTPARWTTAAGGSTPAGRRST